MKERDNYKKLYDELVRLEKEKVSFTRDELATSTGYSYGSIGVYIRNNLRNIHVFDGNNSKLIVKNIINTDLTSFQALMSQKSDKVKQKSTLFHSLVSRSLEAFYSSIIIYNNPLIDYRIESFCILLMNAWELLLKAKIIELGDEAKIYEANGDTISVSKAIKTVFDNDKDPVRKNIELVNEIRNQAVHLLIPDIQVTLSRLFQSSIFNFITFIKESNYPNPYYKNTPGLMSFITDGDDIEDHVIIQKYGNRTSEEILKFKQKVYDIEKEINDDNFIIPIEYNVVLTKKDNEGDIKVSTSSSGESAIMIKVPKDNNKTHPFRSNNVMEIINTELKAKAINQYSLQAILLKEKIRSSHPNKYYYKQENPLTHKYSQEFIDLILEKINTIPSYIGNTNSWFSKQKKKKK